MEQQILSLFWQRDEAALDLFEQHYGPYCMTVAVNVVGSHQEAQEIVNDVYWRLWESIPPCRPTSLLGYAAKITRHLALDRVRAQTALKRGGKQYDAVYEEFTQVFGETNDVCLDTLVLKDLLERFCRSLPEQSRNIFLRRYFYMDSIKQIAAMWHVSESKVKTVLCRTRKALKQYLKEQGVDV